jgi:hypothetical protein
VIAPQCSLLVIAFDLLLTHRKSLHDLDYSFLRFCGYHVNILNTLFRKPLPICIEIKNEKEKQRINLWQTLLLLITIDHSHSQLEFATRLNGSARR